MRTGEQKMKTSSKTALTYLIIAALLCAAAFTSCGGRVASGGSGGGNVKLLKCINDDFCFQYDEQNRIVKMYGGGYTKDKTITYSADNSVTVEENGSVTTFAVKGNTVTVGKETLTIDKKGYLAGRKDEGRIGLYENEEDKDGNFIEGAYLEKYEYRDGNMTEEKDNNGHPEFYMGSFRSYGYDGKKSPFSNSNTPKWLLQYLVEPYYASKNNVIKSHSGGGDYAVMVGYIYEYDSDGFPAKKTSKYDEESVGGDPGVDGMITSFTYFTKTKTVSANKKEAAARAAAEAAARAAAAEARAATEAAAIEPQRLKSKKVPPGAVVTVSSAREFREALGSDRIIELKPGTYNISKCDEDEVDSEGAPLAYDNGVSWSEEFDGYELTLTGISNLTIRGAGDAAGVSRPQLVVDPGCGCVRKLCGGGDIVIDGIKAGHTEGGSCAGGVFGFDGTTQITINNTAMYGSGTEGLTLTTVVGMRVTNSRIYECTYYILTIIDGGDIAFENCKFDGNGEYSMINVSGARNVSFADCEFSGNMVERGHSMFSVLNNHTLVSVSSCVFSGNRIEGGYVGSANRSVPLSVGSVSFSDCKFDNAVSDRRDGNVYKTVKIVDKTWMAQNLNYKSDNSWCYDNSASKCDEYGRLYDWNAATEACPAGWHLPTRDEWGALAKLAGGTGVYGGGSGTAGKKLKSAHYWNASEAEVKNGSDDFDFSALPGGGRNSGGEFLYAGNYGYWWTATERDADRAYFRMMGLGRGGDVDEFPNNKSGGNSVRCVKND
jgi:uncharacterized protein (TIGR02145 family)